jgi:hypothetical protein
MLIPVTGLPDDLAEYLSNYDDTLSKPQRYHFQTYVVGLVTCEGNRTITNINATILPGERKDDTSVSRFVSQYKWSIDEVDQQRVALARGKIVTWLNNREDGRPVTTYHIFDDSTHEKTGDQIAGAGSFRAGGGYKWGKKMVSSLLRVGPFSLPYWGELYLKKEYCEAEGLTFRTTTEMVREQILSFEPFPNTETCVLIDSWFSGWPVISAVKAREDEGFYLIGGLKKSRNIYRRDGSKVNLETRASELERQHYERVKANGRVFYVYRYEGKVSRAGDAPCVVLICRNDLSDPKDKPFFILCTRTDLTHQQIIVRYLKRWGIETGYRNGKQLLGQDEYQGRSTLGTIRHWCLGRVIYTYLELRRVNSLLTQRRDQALRTLGDVCRAVKREVVRALVEWLYDLFQARQNPEVACALLGV